MVYRSVVISGVSMGGGGRSFLPAESTGTGSVPGIANCGYVCGSYDFPVFPSHRLSGVPHTRYRPDYSASHVGQTLRQTLSDYVLPFYFILLFLLSREIYQTAHDSILSRMNSQYQAMYDHLTGVANRRAFEQLWTGSGTGPGVTNVTLSLVIADIDNFKLCNDTHGHVAGDTVLKAVAALLEQHIQRGADFVARIGGEEFAIIFPETDLQGALSLGGKDQGCCTEADKPSSG